MLVSGCSLSDYCGWGSPGNKLDPRCWYNIVSKENMFDTVNVSYGGKSNREILHSASQTLFCTNNNFDLIIIQLTSTGRSWFFDSDDYHNFKIVNGSSITNYQNIEDYNALNLFRIKFFNRLREVERDLVHLVHLHKLAELTGAKLLLLNFMNFANSCVRLQDDSIPDIICGDMIKSTVSKVTTLYNLLTYSYKVGFDKPLLDLQLDYADDNAHPGEKSNKLYADLVNDAVRKIGI